MVGAVYVRRTQPPLPLCQCGVCAARGPRRNREQDLDSGAGPGFGQRQPLHPERGAAGRRAAAVDATLAVHQPLPHE